MPQVSDLGRRGHEEIQVFDLSWRGHEEPNVLTSVGEGRKGLLCQMRLEMVYKILDEHTHKPNTLDESVHLSMPWTKAQVNK